MIALDCPPEQTSMCGQRNKIQYLFSSQFILTMLPQGVSSFNPRNRIYWWHKKLFCYNAGQFRNAILSSAKEKQKTSSHIGTVIPSPCTDTEINKNITWKHSHATQGRVHPQTQKVIYVHAAGQALPLDNHHLQITQTVLFLQIYSKILLLYCHIILHNYAHIKIVLLSTKCFTFNSTKISISVKRQT